MVFQPHRDRQTDTDREASDWDWIFKVDWATLPHLEELCLDFACTGPLDGLDGASLTILSSVADCAMRMECLRLKRLVLTNVRFERGGVDVELAKESLGKLFMGVSGISAWAIYSIPTHHV